MRRRKPQPPHPAGRDGAATSTVIYGWHAARAALTNPDRVIHRVLAHKNALSRLESELIPNRPTQAVATAELDRATGPGAVHQGLAVVCEQLPETGLEDLAAASLLVVLDQITDPHNVGAILRSAAAFGVDALVITERNSPAASGVLAKAASGALEHVPIVRVKNLARAMDRLGEYGFNRIGLDGESPHRLEPIVDQAPTALVFGAEGTGLRRLTREKCDRLARIATSGPISSLNVSNAAAIALYAITAAGTGAATGRSTK